MRATRKKFGPGMATAASHMAATLASMVRGGSVMRGNLL
jgi:hypothetical protein